MTIKSEKMSVNAVEILQALDNIGISIFLYYPQERKAIIPENLCRIFPCDAVYTNMPYGFIENNVYSEDQKNFVEMYQKIHQGERVASCRFHTKDYKNYLMDTLTVVAWNEKEEPLVVFGLVSNATDNFQNNQIIEQLQSNLKAENTNYEMTEVMKVIASSIGSQYYAIYHVCLKEHTYIRFQEKMKGILFDIEEKGSYEKAWGIYIDKYIMKEDQEAMRRFMDLSTLSERLRNHQAISRNYRRIEVGWTRGTFIAGKRDENGEVINAIYTVSDINSEIEMEEKQKKATYEAEHDSLTGAYNRKGFESILYSEKIKNCKVGFAVLDVDNFKLLNDYYGHTMGDQVLVAVVEQLTSVLRKDDIVARIGGDEFALLLIDCDATVWDTICTKIRSIHATLASRFPSSVEMQVTISCGFSFSDHGYSQEMYQLADEGLYETKRLGRAGCTLVGSDHQILKSWQDETLSLFSKNVLEYNNMGICQIEIPNDPNLPRRLICGNTEKGIMGIPKSATPEECYIAWRDRIDPSYRETMHRTEQSMIEHGQTECTFLWNHPNYGKIFLRCGGFGEKKSDRIVLSGYCHTLRDTNIIEKQEDQTQILNALNETFVASYYLDLENNVASAFKLGPGVEYSSQSVKTITELIDFINTIVDSRDREIMKRFSDLNTLQHRLSETHFLDIEYRSLAPKSWCRARILPVKYDENKNLTHVLLTITALESNQFKEVYASNYNRRSLASLFDHLPCGIVMYEWKNKTLNLVHVSKYYKEHSGHSFIKMDENNKLYLDFKSIHPEDANACHNAILHAFKVTNEIHQTYRVWNETRQCYIWEKVDAIISTLQDNTKLIYALYTDVTSQKEQELLLEKSHATLLSALNSSNQICYEYDPIYHVCECLTEDNPLGLPKIIENYPESVKEIQYIHPEDIETFIQTVHQIDHGNDFAQCDLRIKKRDGTYGWYSCTFNGFFDTEKERKVAFLTIFDISLRRTSQKIYEDRLQSLSSITEGTLCMSLLNLTKNTYELLECRDSVRPFVNTSLPLEEYLVFAASSIVGEEDQIKFREMFSKDYLLEQALKGNMHFQMEYLLKVNEKHYEWVFSAIDMVQNPLTGEVTGAVYSKTQQEDKMNQMLLAKTLEQDYLFVATVFVDTDEFYLYNYHKAVYSRCMQNYWDIALINVQGHCSEEIQIKLKEFFNKQRVLEYLENHSECTFAYNGVIDDKPQRLEVRFSYGDKTRTTILASMRNITDTTLLEKYRHDSEHDSLTDLYNRKTFFRKSKELLEAHPEESFAMLHIDIKHFRLYNTFFGDAAGDKLLCDIADIFRWMDIDYKYFIYGRIESDVFAAFFSYDSKIYQRHIEKATSILKNYRSDFLIEPAFGMYFVTDKTMPMEAIFTRASLAAKMSSSDSTNTTIIFNDTMEDMLKEDQKILSEMQAGIDQKQFQVYLQPKYSLRTNKPVGSEALVRWNHPSWGLISPGRFIPLFESNGFIAILDRYMWESTCKIIQKWEKEGKPIFPVSVNVSRISAYSQDTVPFLKALVQKYEINPKYLELELTESAYVESPEEIRSRLDELQKFGFKILMDDFGSGYSSLNTLKDIPIDILKLDMKFLSSSNTERGTKILSSVIRMSKILNLPVIAEGVETEKQRDYLKSIGCEYVQGYLYARPMPVQEYENLIFNALKMDENVEKDPIRYSQIFDVLLRDHTSAQMVGNIIPVPVVLLEFHEEKICCLRANQSFINTFGLMEDLRPTNIIIQEHISEKDYAKMIQALNKCAQSKRTISFKINWKDQYGLYNSYLVKAGYEGHIGIEQVFVVVFMEERPQDHIE